MKNILAVLVKTYIYRDDKSRAILGRILWWVSWTVQCSEYFVRLVGRQKGEKKEREYKMWMQESFKMYLFSGLVFSY